MLYMKKLLQKGFTLIELLIVIGILGILVVAVLLTLNPGEAQKKARDTKRLRDLSTLQTLVEQALTDNVTFSADCTDASGCQSTVVAAPDKQPCNANWLGMNLCNYSSTVPSDPINSSNATNSCTDSTGTTFTTCTLIYRLRVVGNAYEIQIREESKSNASKVLNDGGDDTQWVEIESDTSQDLLAN